MDEVKERMARVDAALARQLSAAMAENARLRATLIMGGYTLSDGAAEWKPPLGPSASPLINTIDRLRAALNDIATMRERFDDGERGTPYGQGILFGLNAAADCARKALDD